MASLLSLQAGPSPEFPQGRAYSAIFRQLPDKSLYPDYYLLIKEPRSLNGVLESIQRGIYSSPAAVAYDLFLIWSNARQYNAEGSTVYNDANVLQSHMKKAWKDKTPPLPPWKSLLRPEGMIKAPKKHHSSTPSALPPTAFNAAPSTSAAPAAATAAPTAFPKIKLSFGGGGGSSSNSIATPPAAQQPQQSAAPQRFSTKVRPADTPDRAKSATTPQASAPQQSSPAPKAGGLSLKLSLKPTGTPSQPSAPVPPRPMSHLPAFSAASLPPLRQDHLPPTSSGIAPSALSLSNAAPISSLPNLPLLPPAPGSLGPAPPNRKRPSESGVGHANSFKKAKEDRQQSGSGRLPQHQQQLPVPTFEVETGWFSTPGPHPIQRFVDIVNLIRQAKSRDGRVLSLSLPASCVTVQPKTEAADASMSSGPIVEPHPSLQSIEGKARAGLISSPEAFDRDMKALFAAARRLTRSDEVDHVKRGDVYVLQRYYHELTSRPPLSNESAVLDPSSLSSIPHGPAIQKTPVTMPLKTMLKEISYKGEKLKTGDWVHLFNPDFPERPIVAQVFKVFQRPETGQKYVTVCWYYRPEDTIHPATRQFYEHEVLKTNMYMDHAVEDVMERAFVMYYTRYVRGRPKSSHWTPDVPLYICEHRYKDDVRSFKRIKNWLTCIPEDVRKKEYPFEKWSDGHVDQLKHIPSPFVRGIKGAGEIGESLEAVEDDQAKFYVLPTGQQATPSALRAVEQSKRQKAQQEEALAAAAAAAASAVPSTFSSNVQSSIDDQLVEQQGYVYQTPAEMAVAVRSFAPLPPVIASKFRSDADGDMLWFTAPAAGRANADDQASLLSRVKRPVHSLEYLYWRAVNARG
ncbi:hypothetical protein ACM66B_002524 [Microbotryomycetes sp. NB124-2]